jgi:hypothetical protein
MFSSREKSGCATTSLLLNDTMIKLLKKSEIVYDASIFKEREVLDGLLVESRSIIFSACRPL